MPKIADIRISEIQDAPQMAALLNEIIAIGGTTAFEDSVTQENMLAWYIENERLYCCHVVVDDAKEIAGFQMLNCNDEYPHGIGDIATFARQTRLVKGVGTALFNATKVFARQANLEAINAKIRADNVSGLAYYSKMGFQDYSVVTGLPLKDGTLVDRVIKRFPLRQAGNNL